jgi:hypothetical protein
MNRKHFIILIAVAIIIGAVAISLQKSNKASYSETTTGAGQKLMGNFPVNDVALIDIKSAAGEVTLAKKDDSWRVKERGDYPANFSSISDFLRKAAELKIVQAEEVGPSQYDRLELNPPGKAGAKTGTVVDFKDKSGKSIKSLILGAKYVKKSEAPSQFGGEGFPAGRWVQDQANTGTASLISDALSEAEPKVEQWLDKDFFKVEKVRSLTVTYPEATNSWKASRESESAPWVLADLKAGEQPDTNKLSALGSPLASPSFNDVAVDAKSPDLGLDKPTVIKLATFDGFDYTLNVGKKGGDMAKGEENYPMTVTVSAELPKERTLGKDEKPEDKAKLDKEFKDKVQKLADKLQAEKKFENHAYLVSKWTLDSILKDRSSFMAEKKEEPKKDDAAREGKSESPVK